MRDNKPATCFIVDDEAFVRQSLSLLIKSLGYRVETFESAAAFWTRKPRVDIGFIISDVKMPGMSGLDLQETLTRRNSTPPTILITGHGDLPIGIGAMKKGAVDFLPKLFDMLGDAFEGVDHEAEGSNLWRFERIYLIFPAVDMVSQHLVTYQ